MYPSCLYKLLSKFWFRLQVFSHEVSYWWCSQWEVQGTCKHSKKCCAGTVHYAPPSASSFSYEKLISSVIFCQQQFKHHRNKKMWHLLWEMDSLPSRTLLQQRNLQFVNRPAKLHETWKAWQRLPTLEMEARGMWASTFWCNSILEACQRKEDSLCWRFSGA